MSTSALHSTLNIQGGPKKLSHKVLSIYLSNVTVNVKRAQIVVIELSLGGNAEVSNTPK